MQLRLLIKKNYHSVLIFILILYTVSSPGDRVKFIAVEASKQFVCEWIATQVSVAYHETEEEEEINDEFSNLDAIENVCDS